jgi:hypothetical protein
MWASCRRIKMRRYLILLRGIGILMMLILFNNNNINKEQIINNNSKTSKTKPPTNKKLYHRILVKTKWKYLNKNAGTS